MLQILSLEVAKLPADAGSVEVYGYVAARDDIDPFLNIIVEQGFVINIAGPNRGIDMEVETLIKYDMRIKIGEEKKC
jgi:hypothetical protein